MTTCDLDMKISVNIIARGGDACFIGACLQEQVDKAINVCIGESTPLEATRRERMLTVARALCGCSASRHFVEMTWPPRSSNASFLTPQQPCCARNLLPMHRSVAAAQVTNPSSRRTADFVDGTSTARSRAFVGLYCTCWRVEIQQC